jgi:hypothetical protein
MKPVFLLAIFACGVGLRAAPAAGLEQQSWTVLDQASHAGNYEVRMQAVSALESMGAGNQKAVDRLEGFLRSDKDPRVRKAAAEALGEMEARQSTPALRAALKDKTEVAFAAAQSLVNMGDPTGQAMVVAVMSGQRSAAPGIVTTAVREVERRFRHPQTLALAGAASATGAAFPPALPGVAAVSNAGSINGKRDPGNVAAVDTIAADPNPYNVSLLEHALKNKRAPVRAEAAKALGTRGDAGCIPSLQPLLTDSNSKVRLMAAASIIRLNHPAAQPVPVTRMSATATKP